MSKQRGLELHWAEIEGESSAVMSASRPPPLTVAHTNAGLVS